MLLPLTAPAGTAYSSLRYTSHSPTKVPTQIMAVATSSVSSQHNHNESFSGTFSGTNPVRKDKMNYLNDLTNSFQKSNLNKGGKKTQTNDSNLTLK